MVKPSESKKCTRSVWFFHNKWSNMAWSVVFFSDQGDPHIKVKHVEWSQNSRKINDRKRYGPVGSWPLLGGDEHFVVGSFKTQRLQTHITQPVFNMELYINNSKLLTSFFSVAWSELQAFKGFYFCVFFLMVFWCLVKSWADFFWWKTLLRSTRWGFFSNQTSPPQNGKKIGQIRVGEICSNSLILNPRNVTCTQELDISHMKNKLVMKLAIGNSFFLSESSKLVK